MPIKEKMHEVKYNKVENANWAEVWRKLGDA